MENENSRYFSFLRSSATNAYQNPIFYSVPWNNETFRVFKDFRQSGKNLMVWSLGFFCSLTFLKKYWQASVNHSKTMQWRSGVHEKLLCSTPSLFPPEKKTVKWIRRLAGSNTFWCWKAVLDHCRGEEVRKNRKAVCSLLQQKPEQSVLRRRRQREGSQNQREEDFS